MFMKLGRKKLQKEKWGASRYEEEESGTTLGNLNKRCLSVSKSGQCPLGLNNVPSK